jgi:hypothetical protein
VTQFYNQLGQEVTNGGYVSGTMTVKFSVTSGKEQLKAPNADQFVRIISSVDIAALGGVTNGKPSTQLTSAIESKTSLVGKTYNLMETGSDTGVYTVDVNTKTDLLDGNQVIFVVLKTPSLPADKTYWLFSSFGVIGNNGNIPQTPLNLQTLLVMFGVAFAGIGVIAWLVTKLRKPKTYTSMF